MLPYLAIGAGIALFAWLSSSENDARQDYEQKCQNLKSEKKSRDQQLKNLKKELKLSKRYQEYLALHHASVIASKQAYILYDKQKSLIALIDKKIGEFIIRINELKQLRKNSIGQQRQSYHDELQIVHQHLSQAIEEIKRLRAQKSKMLEDVRAINAQTHEIKMYIGQHCGEKGRLWLKNKNG